MARLFSSASFGLGSCMLAIALPAAATNGYFSHGYGVKSLGAAGTGIAHPEDALAAATNPAGTGAAGDRIDLGLSWFAPRRSASIVGNAFGADSYHDGNGTKNFFLPEFGWNQRLSSDLAVGVAAYGNGGMNTDYDRNPYARFGASGEAGVNLQQLFVTPSLAWTPVPGQSIGIGINVAVQRFSAKGIGLFSGFSSAPAQVSDQGTDTSTGAGLRLGWLGQVAPDLQLGLTWSQKIRGRFDKYGGLFADGGRFDVPENYGAGLAWAPAPGWGLAADVQRIRYSRVHAVGNPAAALFAGMPLGAANGPGFGWRDITVVKLGGSVALSNSLTLRAGVSHARQPVPSSETFFNVLAPGVVQDHLTFGGTWASGGNEWSFFLAHATGKSVNGSASIPPGNPPAGLGGGNANVRLKETLFGLAYSWKL
jgi:long-chain fatty acid transport protein